ncbi:hypothetical protein LNV28_16560 [Paucibacter sp. DJ2R-2]|nr:hypothetical protein [Paucibacter sp. DJ4R-1]MCV2439905.1 hypothetical protein [Paucibacter sp. DJ2R-2]
MPAPAPAAAKKAAAKKPARVEAKPKSKAKAEVVTELPAPAAAKKTRPAKSTRAVGKAAELAQVVAPVPVASKPVTKSAAKSSEKAAPKVAAKASAKKKPSAAPAAAMPAPAEPVVLSEPKKKLAAKSPVAEAAKPVAKEVRSPAARSTKAKAAAAEEAAVPEVLATASKKKGKTGKLPKLAPATAAVAAPLVAAPAPAAAPKPAAKPAPVPPPAPVRFTLQAQDAALFGRYLVSPIEGGEPWSLQLRGPRPRDVLCSCQAFALSENGSCEHSQFLLNQLRADLAAGWQAEYSELGLSGGARRQLLWRQSPACPAELADEVQAGLRAIHQGKRQGVHVLTQLLQHAAELGHELRVDAAVWEQLALAGDAAERVRLLGEAYPQLFDSPGLRNLLKLPLPHYQLEAALFAVCAGRSLVADDLGLGLYAQALGAAELMLRHFGVERVLVLCAESSQTRWLSETQSLSARRAGLIWGDASTRREQLDAAGEIKIAALNTLQQDLTLLQAYAPELIIIDEAQRLDAATLARLQQLDRGGFVLMLSSQLLNAQPQILLPLVEMLDCHRQGALADFLAEHVHRDAAGRVSGFMALGDVDETLERLVFSRAKSELLPNLPLALVQLRALPLSEAQLALQAPLLNELRRSVSRWQRSGFVSGAEQLQLLRLLQDLRRLAISPQLLAGQADAGRLSDAPKLIAVAAVARELQGRALERLRVCSQWDDALNLLPPVLQSAGIACVQIQAAQPLAQRRALAERWRQETRATVLLCSDAAAQGLDLQLPRCGLLNLELAWGEDVLEQRLASVADDDARGLPLVQLQAQGGFESALLQLQDGSEALPACSLDGDVGLQVLQGQALAAFMQALVDLLALWPAD